jgi:L-fuculose-phosphate aldolase
VHPARDASEPGTIVTTRYATPTSEQVPVVMRDLIGDHDALVFDRHGALTVGAR